MEKWKCGICHAKFVSLFASTQSSLPFLSPYRTFQQVLQLQKQSVNQLDIVTSQLTDLFTLDHNLSTFDPIPGWKKRHALATHQCVLSPKNRLVSITTVLLLMSTSYRRKGLWQDKELFPIGKRLALSPPWDPLLPIHQHEDVTYQWISGPYGISLGRLFRIATLLSWVRE